LIEDFFYYVEMIAVCLDGLDAGAGLQGIGGVYDCDSVAVA
jgi:hypothetical protein